MFATQPQTFCPAIFSCDTIGCTRSFKSEPALRCHQTTVHIIPNALRPAHPNPEPLQEHTDVQFPDGGSLSQDELPAPDLCYNHDGFHIKTHPILDGECHSSSSYDVVLNICHLLH
jgi:hypothetical protein